MYHRIENIEGKEENAGYQHFLLFPQCFQKAFSFSASKVVIMWERVINLFLFLQNSTRVVRLLLENRANTNLLCNGFSALALCIASGNDLAIDELLLFGNDVSLPLTHGVGSALCAATNTEYEYRRPISGRLQLVIRFFCVCVSCSTMFYVPNDKILDVTKLKAFADDKINVAQMMISVVHRVENMVGKGFFLWVIKSWVCVVKN